MVSTLSGNDGGANTFEQDGSIEAFADALAEEPTTALVSQDEAASEIDALAANDDGAHDWSHLALARWFCGEQLVPRKVTRTGSHPTAAALLLQRRPVRHA